MRDDETTTPVPAGMTPHHNLWIERNDRVVLSRWRVQLLQAINDTGSISAAAERMGVQYRLAWDRVDEMEEGLGTRLVVRHVGGVGGGGAALTPAGMDLIGRFTLLADSIDRAVADAFRAQFGAA